MKSKTFNYSLLAVGVAAVMSLSTGVNAAEPTGGTGTGSFDVTNKASAKYTVAGNTTQQEAFSNEVTVKVNETSSFTLLTDNVGRPINPQANSTASFTHTLKNEGNVNDTYTLELKNVTGDDFDYSGYTVTYKLNGTGADINVPITNANGKFTGAISLNAKDSANITIVATADTVRTIDKNGILVVSAESAYLKVKNSGNANAYTASNTDSAKTTTPVYAITKSATTNLDNKTFDIANSASFIKYTIAVKNEGNTNGTGLTISDTLPAGLIIDLTKAPVVTASNGSTPVAATFIATNGGIEVVGQGIKEGETITIVFYAKQDGTTLTNASKIVNHAIVDDKNGMIDSTKDTDDVNYEDKTGADYKGEDANTSEITTNSQTRKITITKDDDKEVALKSDTYYSYTIKNDGTDINEAVTAGDVLFTVAPTTNNDQVTIEKVYVDKNGNGVFDTGDVELAKKLSGEYDLNDVLVALGKTKLAPTEEVKILVQVKTNGVGSNEATASNLNTSETMAVTITPKTAIAGTAAPVATVATTTTTMQGIDLQKYQTVADCTTAVSNIPNNSALWLKTPATALAGQCIFYKLEATNTFTTASSVTIKDVTISDILNSKIAYRGDFEATPVTSNTGTNPEIIGIFNTIAPQAKGVIKFSVTTSQTGKP
ncbi:hypothetical protein [Psychrobacter glacincola]|uniref:hypothetical protein n=1 Tax=Psychrobacter glacincola TaxID=56810 RepID=UPI0039AEDBBF